MVRTLGLVGASLMIALAGPAAAQDEALEPARDFGQVGEPEAAPDGEPVDAAASGWGEDAAPSTQYRDSLDPAEDENVDYFFLGAFYRHVMIPGFVQQLFVDGGIDTDNAGAGLTFNWRKNNFNVIASVWWNQAHGSGYFRAVGDPRTDTELIEAHMGVVFVNAEFLWSFPITDWFAFELGFDLGVGFVYGGLTRTEAYESSPGADDWQPCTGPGQAGTGAYCPPPAPDPCWDNYGGHYECTEPNWTGGGDVPIVIPWVAAPHVALRFKPIRQLQIRVDGGYGLYNFFVGASASYGF